ncbi:Protein of unknown function [Streptococcus thermophilus]|nr:Protein of unknown function [Streptococcus thermophilus]
MTAYAEEELSNH